MRLPLRGPRGRARARGRPAGEARLLAEEEFVAPDHRREGWSSSSRRARRDGSLVGRRGRLVLDGGAYCGEGGFFAQMAAMHAVGPYVVENVNVESTLAYTNNQPSGSIRAPTAPQVCWAVEQHMDELAEALDLDPVELRRRTLVQEGDEGRPSGLRADLHARTLDRAVELIAPDGDLPDDEAIGVSCGWWPSFASRGRLREAERRRLGHDRDRGAGERQRRVMALPILVAEVLGMDPTAFSILYQDTDAAPWDAGSSGSQTTMNSGRAAVAAAVEVREQLLDLAAERLEVAREDLELTGGKVQVIGSPAKAVEIVELAESGDTLIGKGSGPVPKTRRATRRAAWAAWAASRSWSRRSSPTPYASRSTARRASCGCCRSPPSTTRARSSTASARPARCSAAS